MILPNQLVGQFERHFGSSPELLVRAPGRVNLIGEHTDYNDGFVLPCAIDRAVYVAARPRSDRVVHVYTTMFSQSDRFDLDHVERSSERPWSNYVRGVARGLLARDLPVGGVDLLIAGDLPAGSGLSSSAALEVAVGYTFQVLGGFDLLGEELALLAQGAEQSFVGTQCGIMDQFVATFGQAGHALLIDCRDLSYRPVALPQNARFVVCDSGVRRELAASAYNERRAECATALQLLQQQHPRIMALRDVTSAMLDAHAAALPATILRRARHVVSENERTQAAATALTRSDLQAFGALMQASHASLRDDYAVSCPELDALVAAALAIPGCYGSRMTGGGFGGCTVSLVADSALAAFTTAIGKDYNAATGRMATVYVCSASDGVQRVGGGS